MWWRHNAKSEKDVLGDNCEMSDRWWFLAELCVPGHKTACKIKNNIFVTVNNDFVGHSWCDLPMIFTRDFVTRENHWQIASLVNQKSLFTVTYALFIICIETDPCVYKHTPFNIAANILCMRPMRDDVTMQRRLSLARCIHRKMPALQLCETPTHEPVLWWPFHIIYTYLHWRSPLVPLGRAWGHVVSRKGTGVSTNQI